MNKASTIMAALIAATANEMTYDLLGTNKLKAKAKKVWDSKLKCYTINGVPIEKDIKEELK